jgi:hypothetical protein
MSNNFGNGIAQTISPQSRMVPINSSATLSGYSYNRSHLIGGTGSYTITLPLLSAGKATYKVEIINDTTSGTSLIAAQGSDVIRVNGTNQITQTLGPGDSITFEHNGSQWSISDTSTLKASLVSPAFTGVPTVPTATQNTNTAQIASTAFVLGQASGATPTQVGIGQSGSATTFARADHVHPSTAPTPAAGDNSNAIANTAFVAATNGSLSVKQYFFGQL